jgi:RIO-like serine/threonine protein kinase
MTMFKQLNDLVFKSKDFYYKKNLIYCNIYLHNIILTHDIEHYCIATNQYITASATSSSIDNCSFAYTSIFC